MAKFYGIIGFIITEETEPGIYSPKVVENAYFGDVLKNSVKVQNNNQINDNITLNKNISIIADPFANNHFSEMRYIEVMGVKWAITNVEPEFPRLIINVGGVYNGG